MRVLLPAALAVALVCPAPSNAQETLYRPGPGVVLPKVLKQVQPKYTSAALRAKIQGDVEIEAVVTKAGAVESLRVVKSLDQTYGLDDAAVAAAKEWQFQPGTVNGTPVNVIVTLDLTFKIKDQPQPVPQSAPMQAIYAGGDTRTMTPSEFAVGALPPGTPGLVAPKIITMVEAKYTADAMRQKIQGDVEVDVVVTPDGGVSRAIVVTSLSPDLDMNALKAALSYRFQPATQNGQPVTALVRVSLNFRLH
jgi:TonB family protein